MIKNYLKIAFRNFSKNKSYTFINLVGLAIAFCSSILLFLTSYLEFTFNKMHTNGQSIHRVYLKINEADGIKYANAMPAPTLPALVADYGKDIKFSTRIKDGGGKLTYKNKVFNENCIFVDAAYIKMFSFNFLKGDANTALANLNNVVLREDIAKKIFDAEDPIGKTFEIEINGTQVPLLVTGITEKLPENTSIENEMLMRYEINPSYAESKDRWDHSSSALYVQLADKVQSKSLEMRFKSFVEKYYKDSLEQLKKEGAKPDETGLEASLRLMPFFDEHFDKTIVKSNSGKIYPVTLLIISIFILLIASFNFINLSIARSLNRAKEVGMRKALGAMGGQIIGQFWGEAFLICSLGFIIGLLLFSLLLPQYNAIFQSKIEMKHLAQPTIFGAIVLIFAVITALAGGYPAWLVAKFNTISVLKGGLKTGSSSSLLRNGLIVMQFAMAVLLICCTLIIWNQIKYLQNAPIGYNQDQVVSIPVGNEMPGNRMLQLFRSKLVGNPNIISVTAADNNLGRGKDESSSKSQFGFIQEGKSIQTNGLFVDFDYIKTLGLKLKEGRDFSTQFSTDSTDACIINEKMAAQLGNKNLIGKRIALGENGTVIVGIVKDYHFESMKREIESITLMVKGFEYSYLFVKIGPNNTEQTMKLLESTYKSIAPNSAYLGSFLDENRNNQYKKEKRFSTIFISAAVLAILLSCMGLFAITLMVISKRTKEIGVRKVLGSSVSGLVFLLSKDFIKLVLVAVFIASPLAFYAMKLWLQDFAYQAGLPWWVFAVAAVLAVLIAFLTVSFQAIKAALMNPVKSLKTE